MRIKPESPSCARIALSRTTRDELEMRHEKTRENLRVYQAFRGSHLPEIVVRVGKKVREVRRAGRESVNV